VGDKPAGAEERLAIEDHRNIGAGTSNVERNQMVETGGATDRCRAYDACRRTGQTSAHRKIQNGPDRHEPAIGMNGKRLDPDTELFDAVKKTLQVGFH